MIIFDQVTKQYGETVALANVSFVINPGEFVFILGASGAGKTTIGKLLIHQVAMTSGEIQVGDFKLSSIKKKEIPVLRQQIGVAFQDNKLLPDRTTYENIALALEIAGKSDQVVEKTVAELLRVVGIPNKTNLFPSQLSGGELARVVLARALATDPAVLFADEPTGNLDSENSRAIVELLTKINSHGTTIIMATHDENMVKLMGKRVIKLDQGSIADSGVANV